MVHKHKGVEDTNAYSEVVNRLRTFFRNKGFLEVHTQDRLSILAACEDPTTVATFNYAGEVWPLPQTGQMWLEYELLTKPDVPGVFCVSTSYRNEQNPVPGRHKIIFPMFEFESKGTIEDLRKLERELVEHLGFKMEEGMVHKTYDEMANKYQTDDLSYLDEHKMEKDFGPIVFLEHFPVRTSPFWNMRKNGEHAHKIDVIIAGNETIGSAERSTNAKEMREQFQTISDGKYAGLLYDLFGKERVERELEEFLSFDFFPRYGGGIGVTRLIDGMKKYGLV
jgi:aspartyl/asparaginyl-tRNA synthetase